MFCPLLLWLFLGQLTSKVMKTMMRSFFLFALSIIISLLWFDTCVRESRGICKLSLSLSLPCFSLLLPPFLPLPASFPPSPCSFDIWNSVLTELMKRYYGSNLMVIQTHLKQRLSKLSKLRSQASLPFQFIMMTCSLCLVYILTACSE